MKNIVKKSVFPLLSFIIVLICGLSLITVPSNTYEYTCRVDDIVTTADVSDIVGSHNCAIDSEGNVTITGSDPYLLFSGIDANFKSVALKTEKNTESLYAQIYLNDGSGFSESNSLKSACYPEDEQIIFPVGEKYAKTIRLDVDEAYTLKSIEFHSEDAQSTFKEFFVSPLLYIAVVFVALLSFALVFFIESKFQFTQKFINWLKQVKFTILKGVIAFFGCGILALLVNFLIGFNFYRFIFTFAVFFAISYLILCFKIMDRKFENVFLGIILIIGTTSIIVSPMGHTSWDLDSHYKWALKSSHVDTIYYSQADSSIFSVHHFPGKSLEENEDIATTLNEKYEKSYFLMDSKAKLSHIPSGLFIALTRFFGGNFVQVFASGKFANLLIYAIVCYFAIRKLKSGKMIATVIALLPTNIFLATSYSYDYWVTCFGMLGMAYFLDELQHPERPVTLKNTILMCAAFAIASLPKLVYAALLIIPFFLTKKDFKNRKKYLFICTVVILIFGMMLISKSSTTVSKGGDLRGGSTISTTGQISYILQHPIAFAKTIIKFVLEYLSFGNMKNYISNYAYLGNGKFSVIFIVLMLFTAFTDKNEFDTKPKYKWFYKCLMIAIYFVLSAAIASALYIDFTPVGANTVYGCQARYVIPLLFPLLSVIGSGVSTTIMNRKLYNYVVLIPCCTIIFYDIYTFMVSAWL